MAAPAAAVTTLASLPGAGPLRGRVNGHGASAAVRPLGGVSLNLVPLSSTTSRRRRILGNVTVKAAGDEVSTELPEIVKKLQDTWDKVEDKYAVATLGVVAIIALWSSTGLIAAIDRLPVVPGALELVGIGYTAWFVYSNLVFKPDREALFDKIKTTYSDIIGTS